MGMEERHMLEKNAQAKNAGIAILVLELLCCLLGFYGGGVANTAIAWVRIIVLVVLFAGYFITYLKNKTNPKFRNVGLVVLTISYVVVVLFTRNTYMYAFIYLMLFYIMIFMDKKLTFKYMITTILVNLLVAVRFAFEVPAELNVAIIQCAFAIFASVVVYNIVAMHDKQNKENVGEIAEQATKEAELSKALAELATSLGEKFEVAKQDADEMTRNISASNNATGEISESIKVTAEAIEQQTGLTADIQASLEATERDTVTMKGAADDSAVAVKAGKEAMEKLAAQAKLTGELNKKSQATTNELGNRIKDVEAITGEILNISSQTNLLALNASIEAARAGEAGKGFAVVADEIRQLSEQTKNSVNKITDIINRLVENSNEASDNMSQSIAATEEQNQMVENAIQNIDKIAAKNDELVKLMGTISKQVEDILHANTQITDSISNLSAMSEEVAASSEGSRETMNETMASVEELNGLLGEIYSISQQMLSLTK